MVGNIDISWAWGIGLISFAFGLAFGLGIGFLIRGGKQHVKELEDKLTDLKQQHDSYREQVSEHFLTTSELVQKMTDSYREVYEHLASGSQTLCRNPVNAPNLDFTQQPVLQAGTESPPEGDDEQAPHPTNSDTLADNDSDTCIGDAPHVPSLDTEPPVSPRISSP